MTTKEDNTSTSAFIILSSCFYILIVFILLHHLLKKLTGMDSPDSSPSSSPTPSSSSSPTRSWRSSESISSSSDEDACFATSEFEDRETVIRKIGKESELPDFVDFVPSLSNAPNAFVLFPENDKPIYQEIQDSSLGKSKHFINTDESIVNTDSVDQIKNCEGNLEDDSSKKLVPYPDPDSSLNGVSFQIPMLWKETKKVKKRLLKMFDFLDNHDCIVDKNKEKINRQKIRFVALCDNLESALSLTLPSFDGLDAVDCSETLPVAFENYVVLLNQERLRYREENCKLYAKYCEALSELHQRQEEAVEPTQPSLIGFHKYFGEGDSTDVSIVQATTTEVRSSPNFENSRFDLEIARVRQHYEEELMAAEKVHQSLEEQNRLLIFQMTLMQKQNGDLQEKCKIQEENEQGNLKLASNYSNFKSLQTELEKIDESLKWVLSEEEELSHDLERVNEILATTSVSSNLRLENPVDCLQKQLDLSTDNCILLNENIRNLHEKVTGLEVALDESTVQCRNAELRLAEIEKVHNINQDNQVELQNRLKTADNAIENLKSELNSIKQSNTELIEVNKSKEELICALTLRIDKEIAEQIQKANEILEYAEDLVSI